MIAPSQTAQAWKPTVSPWLISFAVMLATFMEVLDSTVANVALPHMAGTFSATREEVLWVITSYLVSNAIILPSGAWFSRLFGRKKFLIICILVFIAASALCGMATSLNMMIFARILQGAGGGALMPISQAILLESFPPNKRGMAMGVWALGILVAPIIGPVLGGWITDNFSWQWIFFINIPIGILSVSLVNMFIEDPPYIKNANKQKIDYIGFLTLIIWIATMQIIFDKGQEADWFNSAWICWMTIVSFSSMVFFIAWELKFKDSIIDLKVFCNKDFVIGVILSTFLGGILYSTLAILPLFLQILMGYTALDSGLAIAPRGMATFLMVGFVGFISDKIDYRYLIAIGFSFLAVSNFILGNVNLQITPLNIIGPNMLMGVALSLIFIPLTAASFATLKKEQMSNATGLFALMRNIGASLGTSIMNTMLSRCAQTHQAYMVSSLTPLNHVFKHKLDMATHFLSMHMNSTVAAHKANYFIYGALIKQAALWAYIDNFRMYSVICLLLVPAAFIFKKPNRNKSSHEAGLH